jgi:hypothetical protein
MAGRRLAFRIGGQQTVRLIGARGMACGSAIRRGRQTGQAVPNGMRCAMLRVVPWLPFADFTHPGRADRPPWGPKTGKTTLIRNNQRRRRSGGNNGPRPQQMAGGNNYGQRLDNRQRGNATQLLEKYRALARDAQQAGDRVTAEYYLQYAEHYYRVLGDYRDRQGERSRGRDQYDGDDLDSDIDSDDADGGDDDNDAERAGNDRGQERGGERGGDRGNDRDRGVDRGRRPPRADNRPEPRFEARPDTRAEQREPDRREQAPRNDMRDADGRDRGRRDWQRDRRERRPERSRADADRGDDDVTTSAAGDDRESLLQALPPAVGAPADAAAPRGRRLGLRRDEAEPADANGARAVETTEPAADVVEPAPRRRGRPRKAAPETQTAD